MADNVNKANNYDPLTQDRPNFVFMGQSGAQTPQAQEKVNMFLRESEFGDVELNPRDTLPAKYQQEFGVVTSRGDASARVR